MPPEQEMLIAAGAAGAVLIGMGVLAVRRRARRRSLVLPHREKPRPLGQLTAAHTPPTVPWREGAGPEHDHPA